MVRKVGSCVGDGRWFIGVDLGQIRDYTAVAVVQRAELVGEWDAVAMAHEKRVELRLRHLERLPLGTPYPEVVHRIAEIAESPALGQDRWLAVDATGVGTPVVELLRKTGLRGTLMPVFFTGGERETFERGYHRVPTRDLVVGLQVVLQRRGLRIQKNIPEAKTLVKEMAEMQVRITPSGREQYGVWREGQHDDLVFAVALATWAAGKMFTHPLAGEERFWRRKDYRDWEGWLREVMM